MLQNAHSHLAVVLCLRKLRFRPFLLLNIARSRLRATLRRSEGNSAFFFTVHNNYSLLSTAKQRFVRVIHLSANWSYEPYRGDRCADTPIPCYRTLILPTSTRCRAKIDQYFLTTLAGYTKGTRGRQRPNNFLTIIHLLLIEKLLDLKRHSSYVLKYLHGIISYN